jgi:hypothetical protein
MVLFAFQFMASEAIAIPLVSILPSFHLWEETLHPRLYLLVALSTDASTLTILPLPAAVPPVLTTLIIFSH